MIFLTKKSHKFIFSILLAVVIILWTEFSWNKFQSTIEFKLAAEFVLKDKNVNRLAGEMSDAKFISGTILEFKGNKQSSFTFKLMNAVYEEITVLVYQSKQCHGFMVKAELRSKIYGAKEIKEICERL